MRKNHWADVPVMEGLFINHLSRKMMWAKCSAGMNLFFLCFLDWEGHSAEGWAGGDTGKTSKSFQTVVYSGQSTHWYEAFYKILLQYKAVLEISVWHMVFLQPLLVCTCVQTGNTARASSMLRWFRNTCLHPVTTVWSSCAALLPWSSLPVIPI